MTDQKKSPRKDSQVTDLPHKKVSKDEAERVKGGNTTSYDIKKVEGTGA